MMARRQRHQEPETIPTVHVTVKVYVALSVLDHGTRENIGPRSIGG